MGAHIPCRIDDMATHVVFNDVPTRVGHNLFTCDGALRDAVEREGGAWVRPDLERFGAELGTETWQRHGRDANAWPPRPLLFDSGGNRVDQVEFHPAWHALMACSMREGLHNLPWVDDRPGAFVARAAKGYLMGQVEQGHGCPITMTFAAVPALRHSPDAADLWLPRITSGRYDPRDIPADSKSGCTIGMAMTEKQGGSDVRSNTTRATTTADGAFELTGHKWFCSAPMCDAFLTLAHTDAGLSCFLVPRWRPDGTRNALHVQRLKNKIGNRSNASSEIEYDGAWATLVGEEGRGVRTIIDMVSHTRLDCVGGSAATMRAALVAAIHNAHHREAFGRKLIDQPLMRNVLADLALESEAAIALSLRLARAYDEARHGDAGSAALARIATAAGKYLVCKRTPAMVYEAMECLGGNGYVEEGDMARFYREAPLNSIWEGSGNVICLDVLRAMRREPEAVEALHAELGGALGCDPRYDAYVEALGAELADTEGLELRARRVVERIGVALQASVLLRHAPTAVADAFAGTRLVDSAWRNFGTLPAGVELLPIIERALPGAA